jgi:hypothetical protein
VRVCVRNNEDPGTGLRDGNLSRKEEPEIFDVICIGVILENIVYRPVTRALQAYEGGFRCTSLAELAHSNMYKQAGGVHRASPHETLVSSRLQSEPAPVYPLASSFRMRQP